MAVSCTCCGQLVQWHVRLRSHQDMPICHDCLDGLNGQRDGQLQLKSGSWLVTGFQPIFHVSDLTRSLRWFERAGFTVTRHDDTYGFAHRPRDLTIHLALAGGEDRPGGAQVYLQCRDATKAAQQWRRAGLDVDGPHAQDHGWREAAVTDPDGNVLRVASRLD